jgi:CheY-like chemotaxis protein
LRNIASGLFVESANCWTNRSETGLGFESVTKATEFACQMGLSNLELVIESQPPGTSACMPLNSLYSVSTMPDLGVILLAEDNEVDVLLTRRAFAKAGLLNPLHVVPDGQEAIAYLCGAGKYSNRAEYPLPVLMLLDLKMPKKNGLEVLQWVREQPGLRALRVIVLTTSDLFLDVNRAYQLGANSYLVKPIEFDHFVRISETLKGYWLWMSKAPEISRPDVTKADDKKLAA